MKKFFSFVAAALVAMTVNAEAITVAEAITAGMALDSAATSTEDYQIEGYVVNAQKFSLTYNNQIWYMADDAENTASQEFQAYGCVAIEGNDTLQVLNGDKVILTGKLFKYYNKKDAKYVIEVKNGTASFVSKVEGDHSITRTVTSVTVSEALTIGAALSMGEATSQQYEITGYVTEMLGKDTDFDQYGNQTYWIADENNGANSNALGAFEVYRGVASEAVGVGDKVKVKTAIKKYNDGSEAGLIESETKCAVTILEKGVEPVLEPITVAEACTIALALADNETSTQKYSVAGYVAKVYEEYNTQYGNISLYMTDDATSTYGDLQIRRGKISEAEGTALAAGDHILVVGKLTNNFYNDKNTPQIYQGQISVDWKAAIEDIVVKENINKVIVDGVVYIVREGKIYNLQGVEVR